MSDCLSAAACTCRLKNIADFRETLKGRELSSVDYTTMLQAKKLGFSDPQLASLLANKNRTDSKVLMHAPSYHSPHSSFYLV